MLPDWIETDGGFWVHPGHAGLTIAQVAELSWMMHARCMACGRGKSWPVADLVEAFPAGATLGAIALRLRCSACGSDQGRIAFTNDTGANLRRSLAQHEAKEAELAASRAGRP